MSNKELYTEFLKKAVEEKARLPEALALSLLIEHCIKQGSFKIYSEQNKDSYDKFDIIVIFNIDPYFGFYRYNDEDEQNEIIISTIDGLKNISI